MSGMREYVVTDVVCETERQLGGCILLYMCGESCSIGAGMWPHGLAILHVASFAIYANAQWRDCGSIAEAKRRVIASKSARSHVEDAASPNRDAWSDLSIDTLSRFRGGTWPTELEAE